VRIIHKGPHPDEGADPHQQPFEPARAIEAAVDQPAVKADAMAHQQRRAGRQSEDDDRTRGDEDRGEYQRRGEHRSVPERMDRIPSDPAFDRVAAWRFHQRVDAASIERLAHDNLLGN
jgi:hypothetical protein